jgi:phosphinothricin acetyltransferase
MEFIIRNSSEADIEDVWRIYSHYVLHSLVTMEESPPSIAELLGRRGTVLECGLPYLVAELHGSIVGYSYAMPYRSRSAYRFTVENSVYVRQDFSGQGIGQALLSALISRCGRSGFLQMIAIIAGNENIPSIRLHAKMGFQVVGTLNNVGLKFGKFVDTVIMQRGLAGGTSVS